MAGEYLEAMRDFTKAIELNPKFAHAYNSSRNANKAGKYLDQHDRGHPVTTTST